jgi:3-phosphoshikimate 1-carboxyvinyltransferase
MKDDSRFFNKAEKVKGILKLPGDKSISHRSLIFSSMADGKSIIKNLSESKDVVSTLSCLKELGITVSKNQNDFIIEGKGYKGFSKPGKKLNAGNSGTTARLLTGLLSAQDFQSAIIGDESLSTRPMQRVISPLTAMGGKIEASENETLPLKIFPSDKIIPINFEMPISSAQVKSAVILAALHSDDESFIIENTPSRDHTERMLNLNITKEGNKKIISVSKKNYPSACEYFIPSDISTASFFIVLTLLTNNSSLIIKDVSLNETRTGFIQILKEMGGRITVEPVNKSCNEEYGDIIIESSRNLKNIKINVSMIPNIIDEIPILAAAGIFASGEFRINNAVELRKKESDRISSLCRNFSRLGLMVEEYEDGFSVKGEIKVKTAQFDSFNDHRIAMAFSIISLMLEEGGKVNNFSSVKISNPGFLSQLKKIIK